MSTTITKIGNSQGIRLKKSMLEKIGLNVNDEVNVELIDNKIIIEKVKPGTMSELFADYVDDGIREPLIFDDETVGKELW